MAQSQRQRRSDGKTIDLTVRESEQRLAERLDRLSAPLAENVLSRAIELHHEELDPEPAEDASVSYEQLAAIAAEIGIDADLLRRALVEQLNTEHDDSSSLAELVLGPKRVTGGMVAEGSREEVTAQIHEWMRELESLYPTRQRGDATTWEPRGGSGMALTLAHIGQDRMASRQTELSNGDQLVELEVDMSPNRRGYAAMGAFFAAIGAVAGGFTAANEVFAPNVIEFLIPFGIGSGLGLASASAGARLSARMIKRKINKALDGIVHLTTLRDRPNKGHGDDPAWSEIADEVDTIRS